MQQQQQRELTGAQRAQGGAAVILFVCQSMALTAIVFLHRKVGERFVGLQALGAIGVMALYTLLWPHDDLRPLAGFFVAFLVMCFVLRTEVLMRRLRGETCHTYYTGLPRLMRIFRSWSEIRVKYVAEPGLVLTAGILTLPHNQPLGFYLILSGLALLVTVHMTLHQERVRALDMNDALIEQKQLGVHFRRMSGD